MKTKRLLALLCAGILLILALASCGNNTNAGKSVIGILPAFTGNDITVTDYEFTKDDFYVMVTYADGTNGSTKDYTIENVTLEQGYYTVRIEYEGVGNNCYVKCHVPIYPSDFEPTADGEHNHNHE